MATVNKAHKSVHKASGNTSNTPDYLKQKVLLPTLKEQQRYLVYKLVTGSAGQDSSSLSKDFLNIHNNILSQCNSMLGLFDGAKAGLLGVKFNPQRLSGVIRVDSKYVDKLKVCLGMIKNISGKDVIVDCIYVSGMVNKAAEKMDTI